MDGILVLRTTHSRSHALRGHREKKTLTGKKIGLFLPD
jgi:hypothetical protein